MNTNQLWMMQKDFRRKNNTNNKKCSSLSSLKKIENAALAEQ